MRTPGSQRIQRFLDELASDAPTPGGGAWAAISAAAGAAMIAMVARLTMKKKGYEAVAERMETLAHECDDEMFSLLGLADRDAHAYREVMAAYKLPKATSEEQHTWSFTLQRALERAADIPLEVARRRGPIQRQPERGLRRVQRRRRPPPGGARRDREHGDQRDHVHRQDAPAGARRLRELAP